MERGSGYGRRGGRGGRNGGRYGGGGRSGVQHSHFEQPRPHQQQNRWAAGPPVEQTGQTWRPATSAGTVMGQIRPAWGPPANSAVVTEPVGQTGFVSPPATELPPIQSLTISSGPSDDVSGQTSTNHELVPIKRPDKGGVHKRRTIGILVNHFPVSFNPNTLIIHYDIDVIPEVSSAKGRAVKLSKATLSLLKEKLFADNPDFPLEMTGYDGEKNVFSVVSLPVGKFKVQISEEEDTKARSFTISVTKVNELKLHSLKKYLSGEVLRLPRDVLQGLDVIMKENPRRNMVSIGRAFHFDPSEDLGGGIAASWGFNHSLRPTSQGLAMCIDSSVLAVRKRMPVLDFLKEHVAGFDLGSFQRLRRQIGSALKGLKVTVTHRRTKQKYTVSGLSEQRACDISFTIEDSEGKQTPRTVRLLDYFREKYPNLNIMHPNIPCLNVGKGGRVNYVPMELCVLVEGQRYPKDNLDYNAATLLKTMSLAHPHDRKNTICGMLNDNHGPCGGGIIENFDINVRRDMTRLQTRVIDPPQVTLRTLSNGDITTTNMDKDNCQWNLMRNSVVEGVSVLRWAVLDFSSRGHPAERLNHQFIYQLVERCNKLGLRMQKPLHIIPAGMNDLVNVDSLERLMNSVYYEKCQRNLQLLLCVMTKKDAGYKYIKWISEIKIGFVTQCCLSKMANKGQDQYLANLGMKINAKLGGRNVDLATPLPLFEENSRVMLIGADVNHPSPSDISSPSIAAIVASTNGRVATKYIAKVSFQERRSEKIIGFGNLCIELIEGYEKLNGFKPNKLVIFRDGVSEGQFDMVLNEELIDLKKRMGERNYYPTVTFVVARKRHHTRLFPETRNDGGKNGNVPPGTVVDTTIVHPFEFDFFLCSHYGTIGTSKPTHYNVLWDEHNFTSDRMQRLIYDLCFTFARCCKPVSLVPPVYYADLLAYRGRLYYDALIDGQFSSGRSSSSGVTSSSSTSWHSFDKSLYSLHSGIQNGMYFI